MNGPAGITPSVDARFSGYVSIYQDLNRIMWQCIATLLAITGFGAGVVSGVLKDRTALSGISPESTSGLVLVLTSILQAVTIFTMLRFRAHHRSMECELATLEVDGYFANRVRNPVRFTSAPVLNALAFSILSALFLVAGVMDLTGIGWFSNDR